MLILQQLRSDLEKWMSKQYPESIAVHGDGNPGSKVMLIGEAPGEQETVARKPFVGKAGKNLDEFLKIAEIDRSELYVTNVVKLRPWKISKAGNVINRPPNRGEIQAFRPWLMKEIELVKPQVIVTLGNVPLGAVSGSKETIGECHGTVRSTVVGILFPMYHPASVIYNRALEEIYREDVKKLGKMLRSGNFENMV